MGNCICKVLTRKQPKYCDITPLSKKTGNFCVLIEFSSPTGKPTWSTWLYVETMNSYLQIIFMEYSSKVWTFFLFFGVLPELLDYWRRQGIFYHTQSTLFSLCTNSSLNLSDWTEANPIKYPKAKKKHCLVFSAELHINKSFERTPHWWPGSRELCARAILSLKNEVFRLVDWILWLSLRAGVEGKHDDNKYRCDWLEGLREIPDIVPPVTP